MVGSAWEVARQPMLLMCRWLGPSALKPPLALVSERQLTG